MTCHYTSSIELMRRAQTGTLRHTAENSEEVFPIWLTASLYCATLENLGLAGLPDPEHFRDVPAVLGQWLIDAMILSDTLLGGPVRTQKECADLLVETVIKAQQDADITTEQH